ncbi:hypothetical protein DN390_08610 [Bacillus sp. SH7-1]|nr:hypothetical protein [Bacillus cereus]MBR9685684.1 hypothetical protein [Bacillus cereus]TQR49855.1 hypothetical protein DJ027_15015 [Bacillus cereus]TXS01136.1 hypothetical protein DN390_08610 [Bacillus sp. SH7-1]
MPPYIFILHNENLFFLTYSLQIPYIQNHFYNRIEVASVPESAKNTDAFRFSVFCALHIEDSFYS